MHMQATKLEQLLSDVAFKFLFVCNRDDILHTLPRQALIEGAMPISYTKAETSALLKLQLPFNQSQESISVKI